MNDNNTPINEPYRHLSHEERRIITRMRTVKATLRAIAGVLGRSPSTISRELERNVHRNGTRTYYTHTKAQEKAHSRLHKSRRGSHYTAVEWGLVAQQLREDWSPEQIANTFKREGAIRISHETIYQYAYRDKKNGGDLCTHLRHRCRKRRKRYRSKDSRGRLAGKRMISDRPSIIDQRIETGHWEIDTVVGSGSKACIVTVVERVTGILAIGRVPNRTAAEVTAKTIELIKQQQIPVISITSDNGSEFHNYKEIEAATGTIFYFANPHHPWERGTNENTNSLIRQYIPKRTSMRYLSQKTCDNIAYKINNRPRKRLDYTTPSARCSLVG